MWWWGTTAAAANNATNATTTYTASPPPPILSVPMSPTVLPSPLWNSVSCEGGNEGAEASVCDNAPFVAPHFQHFKSSIFQPDGSIYIKFPCR